MKKVLVLIALFSSTSAFATSTQLTPVPEELDVQPELIFSGTGIGTAKLQRTTTQPSWGGAIDFGDSSFQVGVAQSLFRSADGPSTIGSFVLGGVTTTAGQGGIRLAKAYVDLQCPRTEWILGKAPRPSAMITTLPLLRDEDLAEFLRIENPYSSDPRGNDSIYGDIAQFTLNQDQRFFESAYLEHATTSSTTFAQGIKGFGLSFDYRAAPGNEPFDRVQAITLLYQHQFSVAEATSGLHQISAGWSLRLNSSVTHQWLFGFSSGFLFGSDRRALIVAEDLGRLNAQLSTLSLEFIHEPFGGKTRRLGLTVGSRQYDRLGAASSIGVALRGEIELGSGLQAVAQYQGTQRDAVLAAVLSKGVAYEQSLEFGMQFHFDAILGEHLSPRRSILNREYGGVAQ